MKLLLIVTVVAYLAYANAAESDLAKELVRSLSEYTQSAGEEKKTISVEGEQKIKLSPKSFLDMVARWSKSSGRFLEALEKMRPKFYRILQGRLEYEDIKDEMETLMMAGHGLYETIQKESLAATLDLYFNSEGFEDPGRCNRMHKLSENFEVKSDPQEAKLRNIEATVVDLECMARDMEEEIASLEDHCLNEGKITINDAQRVLSGVTRYLTRAAVDGMRFAAAGHTIKGVWKEAYPDPPVQTQQQPEKKELNTLLQKFLRTLEKNKP
ncbi:hypothetical protein LOTGIDRAFT_228652 [Lottia gigantea]|uniref:Uncharacterized protein n=1 Tax=Lottia gigantea TaxID=225164 RepID=V4AK77_LOTGI|nr:hypothetical protein LOTGIDRAFT_228652 [Lottia gigantea]ESO93951.1 hypothetical protein LOTGIDRAFT_228652 [Lottia gigantea]